jgi:radical SAM superfamily enzyme YgiQ (UPF0313 family)
VTLIDANIEALAHLIELPYKTSGHPERVRRAIKLRQRCVAQLRSPQGYTSHDRHHAAVGVLRRVLGLTDSSARPDLADYHDAELSPLRRKDLLTAAAHPQRGPYAAYFEALARRVEELSPRVVGISINYLNQALPAMALAGALRARMGPALSIVAGGGLITCWKQHLSPDGLRPAIDDLVFGDGTAPLAEKLGLAQPGLAQPGNGRDVVLDYAGVPWDHYLAPRRVAPLSTSVGCCWSRCRYCPEAAVGTPFSTPYGQHLAEVIDEVADRCGAGLLHLTDSAVPPQNLRLLSERKRVVPWYGFARFHPDLTDEGFCRKLRRSGCVMLQLGLESGSLRVLGRLNKGIDLGQASRALRALASAGVATYVYVMFGTPSEDREDAEQTLGFVVEHSSVIDFVNVSLLNLPRVAPPEPDLATRPLPGDEDLSLYLAFDHPSGWQRREARRFMERTFARHPQVAPLLRGPHVLGANHAPFMLERS